MGRASEEEEVDWLALVRPKPGGEACLAVSRGSTKLPHPKKRSALEHGFVALRMRCATASRRDREARSTLASAAVAALGKSGGSQPNVRFQPACSAQRRGQNNQRRTDMGELCCRAVARGVLACQVSALKQICGGFRRTQSVNVFATSLAFDDTTEKLHLPLHPLLSPAVQQSSWHVCVSLQHSLWGVQTPDGRFWKGSWETMRPSVPLLSTDGEAIFDVLFGVPAGKTMAEVQRQLRSALCASTATASSNDRVFVAMVQSDQKSLMSNDVCGNHANSLAEGRRS